MKSLKPLVFIFLAMILTSELSAAGASALKNAKLARTKTGEIIKCAPSAEGDVKTPTQAISMLKKGMIIHFMPGTYSDSVTINVDGIIIEGEPGKYSDLCLSIKSKGCFVRNLWLNTLETLLSTSIVDSVMTNFSTWDDSRADIVLDNCCLASMYVGSYNKTISISNCTMSDGNLNFWLRGSKFDIENSIISSGNTGITGLTRNKVKFDIANSIFYTGDKFASDVDKANVAATMDDVKKSKLPLNLTFKNVLKDKPLFMEEPSASTSSDWVGGSSFKMHFSSLVRLKNFILKPDSPGKSEGWGANLNQDGFPVPKE